MRKEEKVAQQLIQKSSTVSTAESCTGGLLAHRLTNIPGSSQYFRFGIVAYNNETKENILDIPSAILQQKGAVSEEVAIGMAEVVRAKGKSDYGVGITGIAGPDGGTKNKPVGLVYVAVSAAQETLCLKCQFQGPRSQIKTQAADQALILLLEFLAG
jgi:nicotinamide-nucleotide amidase